MLVELEEPDLLAGNLIPLLGLLQEFSSVSGTFMWTILKFPYELSDIVFFMVF